MRRPGFTPLTPDPVGSGGEYNTSPDDENDDSGGADFDIQGRVPGVLGDGLCQVYDPPIHLYGKLSIFGLHPLYSV